MAGNKNATKKLYTSNTRFRGVVSGQGSMTLNGKQIPLVQIANVVDEDNQPFADSLWLNTLQRVSIGEELEFTAKERGFAEGRFGQGWHRLRPAARVTPPPDGDWERTYDWDDQESYAQHERFTTAYHEAAHAVIARWFNQEIVTVNIIPGPGRAGIWMMKNQIWPIFFPLEEWMYSRIQDHVAEGLAGGVGQILVDCDAQFDPSSLDQDTRDDDELAHTRASMLAEHDLEYVSKAFGRSESPGMYSTEEESVMELLGNSYLRHLKERVRLLLTLPYIRAMVDGVASALLAFDELDQDAVDEIMKREINLSRRQAVESLAESEGKRPGTASSEKDT